MKTDFKIKQFEKFYYFLMKEAPKDYVPWFFPCEPNGKDPCPTAILKIDPSSKGSWHHEKARLSKEQVIEHIKKGYNIGISARKNDPLIIGDVDNPKYMDQTPKNTLTTRSRKRVVGHFFGWDKDGSAKINIMTDDGEIRSNNQYVIAPGSYVPFDLKNKKDKKAFDELPDVVKKDELIGYYTIEEPLAPKEMTYNDFPQFFKDYDLEDIEEEVIIKNKNEKKEFSGEGKYSELFNLKVSDIIGLIPTSKRVGHPLHESDTDANFSLSKDGSLGHCWRHTVSLNAVQFLCVKAEYKPCAKCGTPHKSKGISKIQGDKKAYQVAYNEAVKLGLIKEVKIKQVEDKPQTKEAQEIENLLEKVVFLTDPVDIEVKLKEIKEKTGISLKILREKVRKKKEDFLKKKKVDKSLPCEIDKRFYEKDLLIDISKELDKDHVNDDREKLGTFLVGVSAELPNPNDHVSAAHKGNSSAGKTNMQLAAIKHFPSEENGIATRITQSEMEDRIQDWKRLVITEINKNREGANTEITETFKQVMEGGIKIFKKDNITGESKEINVPQKTGFYGTTETETDDELETRFIVIPVRGSEVKNRKVVEDTLSKNSDIDSILRQTDNKESWIAEGIRGLDSDLEVIIPFAKEINKKFETDEGEKELFDYKKERVKRDVKRLLSLTKAIAWLFQKRRGIIERGGKKIIIAEPTDFITALKIFLPFFNVSYSGLDARVDETLKKIKNLEMKHKEEIEREFGQECGKSDWVIRTELQKVLGISLNTIKNYINKLKDEGLVQVYWSESHPKYYLIRPVNMPISRLLEPITLHALTGHLTRDWQGIDMYKKYKKEELDQIPLVESIELRTESSDLTGVKLTGQNPDVWSESDKKRMEQAGGEI